MNDVAPSVAIGMMDLTQRLIAQGRDVICLNAGEPEFDTAPAVKLAGIRAIESNFTKYTATDGTAELKRAIAAKFASDNDLRFEADQIVVSSGTKPLFFSAMLATLEPGDEVVFPAPHWVSYPDIVKLAGARPVPLKTRQEDRFVLQAETLESAITPRTRMLILNTPTNPTGVIYSRADLERLGEVLVRHEKIWILTDEIYDRMYFSDSRPVSLASAVPALADRIVTVGGMSKSFVMTGWRLGFAAGPRATMRAMSDLLSQLLGSPSSISQAAAVEALLGDQTYIERNNRVLHAKRDIAVTALNAIPGISCVRPDGAFFLFPGCAGAIGKVAPSGRRIESDGDFVRELLDFAEVATIAGDAFGLSPFFRVSYALREGRLAEGLERIDRFCRALT